MQQIEMINVNKKYNVNKPSEIHAIRNISLTIDRGELIAVMGVSGSGKTTLLHILGCLDYPTTGSYILDQERIDQKKSRYLAEVRNRKIGFVLQEFGLILNWTAIENVSIPLLFDKTSFSEIKLKCIRTMDMLGIKLLEKRKVSQLSGGQKQRVAIARALVNKPEIIIADEPTGALDSKTSIEIMNILVDLNEKGTTVIIATHDPIVASRCKRIITITDGNIIPSD